MWAPFITHGYSDQFGQVIHFIFSLPFAIITLCTAILWKGVRAV
jgi:hypothetical protein